VLLGAPKTKYLLGATLIAIEVLSEDHSMSKMTEKLAEYDEKGAPNLGNGSSAEKSLRVYSHGDLN
jgi:hypothetical protein